MRLIDGDRLEDTLREHKFDYSGETEYNDGVVEGLMMARDDVIEAPTIEAEPVKSGKWVSVKEMLPEVNGRYLVTRGLMVAGALWNRVYIANYSDLMGIKSEKIWWQGNVGKSDFERLNDVVSWMPLPKPWKGRDE